MQQRQETTNTGASTSSPSSSAAAAGVASNSSNQPPPHSQQVPMITPHSPQLPAGPGVPPLGLPFPLQAPPFPSEIPMIPHPAFYAALPEDGGQSAIAQQRQQLLALALVQQQQQQQGQHINPALIPMMQPHPALSVDPTQPGVIFQFPEVARHHHQQQQQQQSQQQQQQQQKVAAIPHMAIPETFAVMTQPFPQLAPGIGMVEAAVSTGARHQDEQQRLPHVHPSVIPGATPLAPGFHPMDMHAPNPFLLQQQQQQQLLQQGIRGTLATMPDNVRREQEFLKDPLHLAQYMALMQTEQHQQQQQLQLQEMLIQQQQELYKQQQQKYAPAALRPGVIMQPK